MLKKILIAIVSLFAIFILAINAIAPKDTTSSYPKDKVLIERFRANQSDFEQLLNEPENSVLMHKLQIIRIDSNSPANTVLSAWYQDILGIGGCEKGYVYSQTPIEAIVESIDAHIFSLDSRPCSSHHVDVYQKVTDHWYLYYYATN